MNKTYTGEEVAELMLHYIKFNSFMQGPEAANYGMTPNYRALEAEDLEQFIKDTFLTD